MIFCGITSSPFFHFKEILVKNYYQDFSCHTPSFSIQYHSYFKYSTWLAAGSMWFTRACGATTTRSFSWGLWCSKPWLWFRVSNLADLSLFYFATPENDIDVVTTFSQIILAKNTVISKRLIWNQWIGLLSLDWTTGLADPNLTTK